MTSIEIYAVPIVLYLFFNKILYLHYTQVGTQNSIYAFTIETGKVYAPFLLPHHRFINMKMYRLIEYVKRTKKNGSSELKYNLCVFTVSSHLYDQQKIKCSQQS